MREIDELAEQIELHYEAYYDYIQKGYNPHFVSKGYGGIENNNTLVKSWHSPQSVGDESLLLSEIPERPLSEMMKTR